MSYMLKVVPQILVITMSKVGSLYPSLLDTFIAMFLLYDNDHICLIKYNNHINVVVCSTISCTITYKNCKQNECQLLTADTNIYRTTTNYNFER